MELADAHFAQSPAVIAPEIPGAVPAELEIVPVAEMFPVIESVPAEIAPEVLNPAVVEQGAEELGSHGSVTV
jgi:hypothetical protein